MSLRVGWNFGSTAEEECQDVVMQDSPCWTATSAVLKAGRGFSSWLFSNLSPPSSPLVSSFFCKDPFNSRQPPNAVCSPQLVECHTPYPSPTPSFIGTLPQELLEEIFREFLHGATATSPSSNNPPTGSFRRIVSTTGTTTTPFTLAQVCSSWRAIVMSNPSLWSRLCAFRLELHDIPLFQFWIRQSSGYPLDLSIVQRRKGELGSADDATYRLLSIALEHTNHWKTISLRLDHDMEAPFVTLSERVSHPSSLQSFRLDLVDWSSQGCQALSRFLSTSPVLGSAAWGNTCQIQPFILETPWPMLQAIRLGDVTLLDLCSILTNAPLLKSLSVDFLQVKCTPPSSVFQTSPHILLPSLAHLSLTHYDDVGPFFNILRTPALSVLTLEAGLGSKAASPASWTSLTNLIHRSRCRVSSLNWSDNRMDERSLIYLFSKGSMTALPHVSHLRIDSPTSRSLVDALTLRPGKEEFIFPDLLSLQLRDCYSDTSSVQAMLASRSNLRAANIQVRNEAGLLTYVALDARGSVAVVEMLGAPASSQMR